MPKDEPIKCRSFSFSLPETQLAELEKQAQRESKGRRPNKSAIVFRALQAELKRCQSK